MGEPVQCRLVIAPDGLPQRTEAVLQRERGRIPAYIQRLVGGNVKGEVPRDPEPPTVDQLLAALAARQPETLGVAAFLAGRCRTDDGTGVLLDAALAALVNESPVDDLGLLAEGYVEAALAIGLRGDPAAARARVGPVLRGRDPSHRWLAAAALAQLGDPSGWPVLRSDLREGIDHVRLMSARQLVLFLPYDGQEVAGSTVDVEGELRRLVDDPSEWVRGELGDLLEEAGFAG